MLEAYLRELERELARTLPDEDVQTRLAEAEAHLKDGIEARTELGLSPTEAERETVAAFGGARQLARIDTDRQGSPKARLLCLGAGYAFALLWTQILIDYSGRFPGLNALLFQVWLALGVIFAVLAFLARRPHPVAIFVTVLGSTTLTWLVLGTTWLNLSAFGGHGVLPRNTTPPVESLAAVVDAQAHPWQNALSMAPGIFEANTGVAAFAILVDYAFGGLGTLFSRRRKGRRRGVA